MPDTQEQLIASLKREIEQLRKRCERAERSEQNFLTALRLSPMALCHHDTELRYTWLYNGHMGFVQDDVLGKTDWDILEKDLADRMGVIKRRVLETGIGERVEMPTVLGDPSCEYFDLVVEPLRDPETQAIIGLACSGIDVTDDRRRREAYRTNEENLRYIFSASPLPITVTRISDGDHLFYNDAANSLFQIEERNKSDFDTSLFSQFNFPQELCDQLAEGALIDSHRFEHVKDGQVFHLSLNARQIFYNNKAAILATFTDLTQQMQHNYRLEEARQKAERLAHTDVMTGLDNRRSLYQKCGEILKFLNRSTDHLCAVVIDIDYFKKINDTWGHNIGDHAIKLVGDLLKQSIRRTDIAARYGGEEFALILPNTDLHQAYKFAEKIRLRIEEMVIETENESIDLTASFGVATYNTSMNEVGDLLNAADIALYSAKRAGRNCVKIAT